MAKTKLESKNGIIGYLVSLLFHIFLIAMFFLIMHKNENEKSVPPPPKGQELKLSDFNAPPPMPSQPEQPQKETPKQTPQQQKTVQKQTPQKQAQKEPDVTKAPSLKPKEQKEHNNSKQEPQKIVKQTTQAQPQPQQTPSKQTPQTQSSSGSSLLDALNTKVEKEEKKEVGAPIKELYGKEFDQMTPEQKKYIQDNLSGIGRITQQYLRYPELAGRMNITGQNVVEFMLMPNGDITDLKLFRGSGYEVLDDNSIKTIKLAYKDYPRPSTPTKIRIFVRYSIY